MLNATSTHWLVRIAERSGLLGGERPDLPADTPTADAWTVLTRRLKIPEDRLARIVAEYYRLDVANLEASDPQAALLIPESLARRHHVFPLDVTPRHLYVATSDPTDIEAERTLGFTSGRTVEFRIAPPAEIKEAIEDQYSAERAVESLLEGIGAERLDSVQLVEDRAPESITEKDAAATPVVKLTNLILRDGIEAGASDIHIEPTGGAGSVRLRVDGVLRHHMQLPMAAMNRIVSRIKILSRLDIADRIRPQDGRARVSVGSLAYDLRVSTIPAGGTEKCVIRILDSNKTITLDDLSIAAPELAMMRRLLGFREGIVVLTGPTGSGKTTTLYGCLRELATGRVNIMTVEDPVEYELPSVTQTQVEVKQGVTFAKTLRAILRQDPDIILVGEIRDRETAEVAAQAAMTGHLVLTTVHANDAVSAVPRLADLGLTYPTIAATLRGAAAQRLLRKVCFDCAELVDGELTAEEVRLAERHGVDPVVRASGCAQCGFTGYRGRLPVIEIMTANSVIQRAIENRKGPQTLFRAAVQGGMRPMRDVALEWVKKGETTLVEVERLMGQILDQEEEAATKGPPRILLVDDDEAARLTVRRLLSGAGYQITEAEDGQQALDILKQDGAYSLMILDLSMPRLDGFEVLKHVRGAVDTAALPVLIRTGTGSDRVEAELLDAGADDYVTKAVDPNRFLARVRAVLRRAVV